MQNKRIIAIDILKFMAIILMIEGHSLDVLLNKDLIDSNSILYHIWLYLRGITAPLFLFCFGFLFAFKTKEINFNSKYYTLKGLSLILMGYLLRFPSHKVFFFDHVTFEGWKIFFAVDIFHLIGVSIFIFLLFSKLKTNSRLVLLIILSSSIIFFQNSITSFFDSSNLAILVRNYFTKNSGSLFPIIPWFSYASAGYITFYAINKRINILGLATLLFTSLFINFLFFERLLTVLLLLIVSILFSNRNHKLPSFMIRIADNSMFIYIFHIIILYGCAWFPGLKKILPFKYDLITSILITLFFYILIFRVVYIKNRYFCKSKKTFETDEKIGNNESIIKN